MRIFLVSIISALILWSPLCAAPADQPSDTIRASRFQSKQLILPAALVAWGAFGINNGWWHRINDDTRKWMADLRGNHPCRADDYLRFVPSAVHLGLGILNAKAKHNFKERLLVSATAHAAMAAVTQGLKLIIDERRPDGFADDSFPSGHTALAFTGAELTRAEYGTGYGVAAYAVACGVAFLRLYNDDHWLNDVIAGAGIGILSARIGYWLLPAYQKAFHRMREKRFAAISACPYYNPSDRNIGISVSMTF